MSFVIVTAAISEPTLAPLLKSRRLRQPGILKQSQRHAPLCLQLLMLAFGMTTGAIAVVARRPPHVSKHCTDREQY